MLIFDEPFSGFDPINTAIIRKEILALSKNGTTIIFSTHRMETVEEICSHIALINKSKMILEGPIKEIKEQYNDNTYEITTSKGNLLENNYFNITNREGNIYTISLKESISQKEILKQILKDVEIISFQQKIPTMEKVFIKAVNNA